jgi:transcriptional regulator with XRE-family HTH domain
MAKKTFKRLQRTGKLTAQEAARDEDLRRKIEAEFPPLEAASASPVLRDPLKEAIVHSAKSVEQLAHEAGVSQVVLTQFLAGQRDLRLATAEKLASVLRLRLIAN